MAGIIREEDYSPRSSFSRFLRAVMRSFICSDSREDRLARFGAGGRAVRVSVRE